jgi:hypothetical protein
MPADREGATIQFLADAFDGLDESARRRVQRWLIDRYGDPRGPADPVDGRHSSQQEPAAHPAVPALPAVAHTLVDLEALYAAAKVTAQWERALITGYWLQEIKRQKDFDAMAVNQAIRQCGYGISNITRELTRLTTSKHLMLVQIKPRRRFRLSREGLRWSNRRLGQPET